MPPPPPPSSPSSVSLDPVVILGGGIIGVSVAYHLSLRGVKPLVIDRAGIAAAASGKAGGFLARDWCDSSPVGKLARRSFDLHEQLGQSLGREHDFGYRKLDTLALVIEERKKNKKKNQQQKRQEIALLGEKYPPWIDGRVEKSQVLGTTKTTAQVHPKLFTQTLWRKAQENGATSYTGKVEDVKLHFPAAGGRPEVAAIIVDGHEIPAKNIVVAMGPWSGPFLYKFLYPFDISSSSGSASGSGGDVKARSMTMTAIGLHDNELEAQQARGKQRRSRRGHDSDIVKGQKAYSILLRPNEPASEAAAAAAAATAATAAADDDGDDDNNNSSSQSQIRDADSTRITPLALFVNYLSSSALQENIDPEFYPRPDGTVYVCGVSEVPQASLEAPESITTDEHAVGTLRRIAGNVSSTLSEEQSSLELKQACYLPISLDGLPIIGKVSSVLGAYVATGHSCWGILNAPITGHLLADLMIDGITEMNIDDFSPDRFLRKGDREQKEEEDKGEQRE